MKETYRVTVTVKGQQLGIFDVQATSPFMAKNKATELAKAAHPGVTGEFRFKVGGVPRR